MMVLRFPRVGKVFNFGEPSQVMKDSNKVCLDNRFPDFGTSSGNVRITVASKYHRKYINMLGP